MGLTRAFMLDRMTHRDAEWDGKFIVGVTSTGIYCLPSCAARNPKPENVKFYFCETDARAAGLRACLRCKPALFYKNYDPDWQRLCTLIGKFDANPAAFPTVSELVATSGMGLTKINAIFRRHFHLSPSAFINQRRMNIAARLLATGADSLLQVGYQIGIESQSTFHERFRQSFLMTPGSYRKFGTEPRFRLRLPLGYCIKSTLTHWGREENAPDMRVRGTQAEKAILIENVPYRIGLSFHDNELSVTILGSASSKPTVVRQAHKMVLAMLGIGFDVAGIQARATREPIISRLIGHRTGLFIPRLADPFEGLIWVIAGQQVNLRFAFALRRALILETGRDAGNGLVAHPSSQSVASLSKNALTAMRFSGRKAEYILSLSEAMANQTLPLGQLVEEGAVRAEQLLLKQRGIGPWSARYLMMRVMGLGNVVPVGDAALVRALRNFYKLDYRPNKEETMKLMEPFEPHCSLATFHLWASLGA